MGSKKKGNLGIIIGSENISQLFLKYTVKVGHTTPRIPTVFEWLFLEVLIRVQSCEDYSETKLADLFHNVFRIVEPDSLLLPTLKNLVGLELVQCEVLTDSTSLADLAVQDVHVLPLGETMVQREKIIGSRQESSIDFFYDVVGEKIVLELKERDENPLGNYIEYEDISFPERIVRNFLEERSKSTDKGSSQKKNKGVDWIKPDTEIVDLKWDGNPQQWYVNKEVNIHLKGSKEGLVWRLDGVVPELCRTSLENFDNEVPEFLSDCSYTSITDPDTEITQVLLMRNLRQEIMKRICYPKVYTCIMDANVFGQPERKQDKSKNKDKSFCITIVSGANKLVAEPAENHLVLYVPEKVLDQDTLFLNSSFSVQVEKFCVAAGNYHRDLTLAYIPKAPHAPEGGCDKKLQDLIRSLVQKYSCDLPEMLLLLSRENELEEEFDSYLDKVIAGCPSEEISRKLGKLNSIKKDVVPSERVLSLLLDKEKIKRDIEMGKMPQEILAHFFSAEAIKGQALKDCIKTVLGMLPPFDSSEPVWELLEYISGKGNDIPGYLYKQEVIQKLYSIDARERLVELVFSGEKVPDFPLEKEIGRLHSVYMEVDRCKNDKKKFKEKVNQWSQLYGNLKKNLGDIQSLLSRNQDVQRMREEMGSIGKTGGIK